jgi:uncharacterized protein with beta-barrel porin domain
VSLPVNGHVTVAGARLNVVGDVSALSRVSTVPVFAARGGTSGGFVAVSAPSSLDVFMTTRGSNLLLTVERTDLPLAALATTANARAAATALDVARATATPDLHDVIRELAALPDADVTTALGQLGGAGSAVALRLGALDGQEALRSIADRMTDLRLAARPGIPVIESADPQRAVLASAPAEDSRPSFWFRVTGSDVSATAINSEPRLQGGLLGVDRQMGEGRWRLGAFGGYDRAALIGDSGANAVRDRRYRAGAYAMTTAGVVYVDAAVAGAYHRFETTRHFAFAAQLDPQLGGGPLFGGVDRSAAARYEGHEVTGFVESGLRRTLGRVLVEPFAGIDASRVSSAGFAESGAGSVNLVGSDALTASLRAAVGLRATRSLTGPGARTFAPRVEVRYLREVLDPTATVRVAFADASANPFAITSPADGSHAIAPSGGFVLGLNRRLWLSADYRAVFAPTSRRHAVTLGLAF